MITRSLQNLIVNTLLEKIEASIDEEPIKYDTSYVKVIDGVRYLKEAGVKYALTKVREEWIE